MRTDPLPRPICPHCHQAIPAGWNLICPFCGQPLETTETPAGASAPVPVPSARRVTPGTAFEWYPADAPAPPAARPPVPRLILGCTMGLLLSVLFLATLPMRIGGMVASTPSLPSHGDCQEEGADGTPIPRTVRIGDRVPDFPLDSTDGETVFLRDLTAGHPVWLNFWKSTCEHCQKEMPDIQQVYPSYKARGLRVIGIDVEENPVDAAHFVAAHGFDWQFVYDSDNSIADWYCIREIPTHVFVDRAGIIRQILIGRIERAQLRQELDQLLAH